ncbi:MAG: anion permease [bacterium]|nr:anion permease [bacterium]
MSKNNAAAEFNPVPAVITLLTGMTLWFIPAPEGVSADAWHLLAVFIATIVGIITKPLPMGVVAVFGITATVLTGILSIGQALSGFGNSTIWLIVTAFFVSRGFIKTGLGARIAWIFIALFGKRSLGLAYGIISADLVLAPAIPSNTARSGGVLFPLLKSIAEAYGSNPEKGTSRRIGAFLIKTSFQGTVITSAMFMTAMAANPLAVKLAGDMGVEITWMGWASAAFLPGIVSLLTIPWIIYKLYPPEIKETPDAVKLAKEKLSEKGPVSRNEILMFITFILLLGLWIFGRQLGIHSTTAALTGLCVLLITGVLTWEDILSEKGAWNTLVWFAALVMMAAQLNELGFIPWFSDSIGQSVAGVGWIKAFTVLSLVYFYSHYFFASNTAHVSSMYAPFLAVAIAAGTPPVLAALVLAFFSNLFSSMTHYGTGPAPVLFGSGYVDMASWWKLGGIISIVNIIIWLGIGGIWWKVIALW